jgi:transposase
MGLPRFLSAAVPGFEILDIKEWLTMGRIEIYLERKSSEETGPLLCHCCGTELKAARGKHRMRIQGMPTLGLKTYFIFWRHKRHCPKCKKARSEAIAFLAPETPHLTKDYAWWIGRMCEIAAVSRVAELTEQGEMSTWRLDFARMKRLLQFYKIPPVMRISVDEVYARKKAKYRGESRNERFFTVISDLDTHRVVWVSESRSQKGLDEFFVLIGKEACQKIEVVAMDQHEDYAASVRAHCPNATIVWDRFHLMQLFEEAVNDTRKELHAEQAKGSEMQRLTRGAFRFLFLKKASRRTEEERTHIEDVMKENNLFFKLELIKERMLSFFLEPDEQSARKIFDEVGDWIFQAGFHQLMKWHNNLEAGWETLKNYFKYRVTSALSEGQNNVIKMLKRRAFGYRNMTYFRLKIMQVCGYLNSRFVPIHFSPTYTKMR